MSPGPFSPESNPNVGRTVSVSLEKEGCLGSFSESYRKDLVESSTQIGGWLVRSVSPCSVTNWSDSSSGGVSTSVTSSVVEVECVHLLLTPLHQGLRLVPS